MNEVKKPATSNQEITKRFLSFSLGTEEYAIPLLKVKEVIAVPEITPVPFTPPHFVGVMNLRGQIISIIDLRIKFGMKELKMTDETTVIIVNLEPLFLGVIVDSVNRVFSPEDSDISNPPELLEGGGGHITNVVRKGSQLTLILDIGKTLDVEDLTAINQSSEQKRTA